MPARSNVESFHAIRDKWEKSSRASLDSTSITAPTTASSTSIAADRSAPAPSIARKRHSAMPGRPSLPAKGQSATGDDRDSRLRRFSSFTSFANLTAPLNPFSRRDRRQTTNIPNDSAAATDLTHEMSSAPAPVRSPRKVTGSRIPSINVPTNKMAPVKSNPKKGGPIPRSQTMSNLPPPMEAPIQPRPRVFSPMRYYNPSKPANVAGNPLTASQSSNNLLPPTRIPTPIYRKSNYVTAGKPSAGASNVLKMSRSTTQPNMLEVPREADDDNDMTPRQTTFKDPRSRPPRTSSLLNMQKENNKPQNSKPPVLPRPVSLAPGNDWFSGDEEDYEYERDSYSDNDDSRPLWSSKPLVKDQTQEPNKSEALPKFKRPQTPAAVRKNSTASKHSTASQTKLPRLNSLTHVKQEGLLRPLSPPTPRSSVKLQPTTFQSDSSANLLANAAVTPQSEYDEYDTSNNLMDNAAINRHFKVTPHEIDSLENFMNNSAINRQFKALESGSSVNLMDNAAINAHFRPMEYGSSENFMDNAAINRQFRSFEDGAAVNSQSEESKRANVSPTTHGDEKTLKDSQRRQVHEAQKSPYWSGRFATIRNRHLQEAFIEDLALDPRSIYDEYMSGDEESGFSGVLKDKAVESRQYLKVFDELRGFCMTEEARQSLWDFEVDYFKDFFTRLRNICRSEENGAMITRRLALVSEFRRKFATDNNMPSLLIETRFSSVVDSSIGHPSVIRSNPPRQQQQLPQRSGTTERKPSFMEKLRNMAISKKSQTSLMSNSYTN